MKNKNTQRNIVAIILGLFVGIPGVMALADLSIQVPDTVEKTGMFQRIFEPINGLQDLDVKLSDLKSDLQYEKAQDFPSSKKIDEFSTQIVSHEEQKIKLQTQLKSLKQPILSEIELKDNPEDDSIIEKLNIGLISKNEATFEKSLADFEEEKIRLEEAIVVEEGLIEKLVQQIEEQEHLLEERRSKNEANIQALTREINTVEEIIAKQQRSLKDQGVQLLLNASLFIGLILGLFVFKLFLVKIFDRLASAIHVHKRAVLLHILKVTLNVIIIVLLLGILFSQVFSVIPFVALVGTGIAFALRDSISSFFAWFFIGSEHGYKVGDVIRLKEAYGRVKEVTPFFTVLRQREEETESGKIVTIPNKFFLEQKVENLSRFQNFTQVRISFTLNPDSDFDKAREILLEVIEGVNLENQENLHKYEKKLTRDYRLEAHDLVPIIYYEPGPGGIVLNAKFFASFVELNRTRHTVIELYVKRIKTLKTVNLKF